MAFHFYFEDLKTFFFQWMGWRFFLEFSANVITGRVLPWSHPHQRNHDLPQLCLDTLHEAWPSITRCSRDLPSTLWCSHSFCLWGGEWLPLSVGKHVFWQRTKQSWRRRRLTMTKPWELTTELKNYWRKLKNAWAKRLRMAWKVSACSFWKMLWQMQKMLWQMQKMFWQMRKCVKTELGKLWNWRESKHHSPRQVKLQRSICLLFQFLTGVVFCLKHAVIFGLEGMGLSMFWLH